MVTGIKGASRNGVDTVLSDCASIEIKRTSGVKPNGSLVLVSSTYCYACTPSLSTSSSSRILQGELILRGASHLDAFSGYPVRT